MRQGLHLTLALCLLAAGAAPAAEVSVHAELSSMRVVRGESFDLDIVIDGPMRGIGRPEFPVLDDIYVVGTSSSSNISIINGRSSNRKVFSFALIADHVGELTIPPVSVEVKGRTYSTEALNIEVLAGGAPAPPQRGTSRPSRPSDQSAERWIFIESKTDRDTVYVGEQVTYHFSLFRHNRIRFIGAPQYSAPETVGFWAETLGDEISGMQNIGGRQYAVTELRQALFPQGSGTLKIGPAKLSAQLADPTTWDFFGRSRGREKIFTTEPILIEALPLPEAGRPTSFGGSVARNLKMEIAAEAGPYEVGQPLTLTVTITGDGNPRGIAEPRLTDNGHFRLHGPDLQSESSISSERLLFEKSFTWLLVPETDGEIPLPRLSFAWFDPDLKEYRETGSAERVISVGRASSEAVDPVVFSRLSPERAEAFGREINHIIVDDLLAGDGRRFPRSTPFWIFLALPWPLTAGALFWQKRRDSMLADAGSWRARRARGRASRLLASAGKALRSGDFPLFCQLISRGLNTYLGDRFSLSEGELTGDGIRAALARAGVDEELGRQTTALLADCDQARFAPGGSAEEHGAELLRRAGALIANLDRATARGRGAGRIVLPCLLLLAALVATPALADSAEDSLREAAALYEAGDDASAAGIWQELIDGGLEDSHVWFNLGNARFRQQDWGRATLAYRRALRLAPRNRLISENLDLLRARRPSAIRAARPRGLGGLWLGFRRLLSPGEMALTGLVLLWLTAALLIAGITRFLPWQRMRVVLTVLLLLLALFSVAAWTAEWEDWSGREAVMLAQAAQARSGPGEDFLPLFELRAGAELRIREKRHDWVRISLDEDLQGWVPAALIESL